MAMARSRETLMRQLPRLTPYLLLSGLLAVVLFAILRRTGGELIYSMDDPFIQLALSEQLFRGHYGINPDEVSSPSSSILWPFLLVATVPTWLHKLTPLFLCWASAMGFIWALRRLLVVSELSDGRDLLGSIGPVIIAVVLNSIGLVFLGMEHMAHVMVCTLIALGLVTLEDGPNQRLQWWFVAALLLCPWLRYEGLAVTGLACLFLIWRGHTKAACIIGGISLAVVIGFSLFLVGIGLLALPSSVLVKTDADGLLENWPTALWTMVTEPARVATLALGFCFAWVAVFNRDKRTRGLALFGAGVAAAQVIAGQYGGFARYGVYHFAVLLAMGVFLCRRRLGVFVVRYGQWAAMAGLCLLAIPFLSYVSATARTPRAAADIYTQQYQMHRFATRFHHGPIAVNDLGCVAYRNPEHVVDLWGLGSESARLARASGDDDPAWIERATSAHGVKVAMVYETWFAELPASWQRLALVRNPSAHEISAEDTVSVLLVDPHYEQAAIRELEAFAQTVPSETQVQVLRGREERSLLVPLGALGCALRGSCGDHDEHAVGD